MKVKKSRTKWKENRKWVKWRREKEKEKEKEKGGMRKGKGEKAHFASKENTQLLLEMMPPDTPDNAHVLLFSRWVIPEVNQYDYFVLNFFFRLNPLKKNI